MDMLFTIAVTTERLKEAGMRAMIRKILLKHDFIHRWNWAYDHMDIPECKEWVEKNDPEGLHCMEGDFSIADFDSFFSDRILSPAAFQYTIIPNGEELWRLAEELLGTILQIDPREVVKRPTQKEAEQYLRDNTPFEWPENHLESSAKGLIEYLEQERPVRKQGGTIMREIKFRAWHKEQHWLHPVRGMASSYDANGNMVDIAVNGISNSFIKTELELLQYTGLKNRNGVEIYEGDILGGPWGDGWIKWCEECKSFAYFCKDFGCLSCSGDVTWREIVEDNGELEVIGNIYENPEP